MKIKNNQVRFELEEGILSALHIVERIYRLHGQEPVITSAKDGNHMTNSLHYKGQAIDLRIRFFSELEKKSCFDDLTIALGDDFDLVWESDHFHLEYDPK